MFLRPRHGVPDILDAIQDLGGIASPSQSRHADKGDFDGFAEALTGPARLLIRRRGGLMPDQLVNALTSQDISTGQTFRLESTSDLYDAIAAAVTSRAADKKQAERDRLDLEFYEAALTNKTRVAGCAAPIPAGQLKVGDKFRVKRDQCHVHDLDPDTSDIDVRCSPRFGRQKVPDGSSVFPDHCRVESENPIHKRRVNADLFGAPESVAEQKQRLAAEESRRLKAEQREELRRRSGARLSGRSVDTTGDLFDPTEGNAPLFAVRRRNPLFAKQAGRKIVLRRGGLTLREFDNRRQLREWSQRHRYRLTRVAA